MGNREWRIEKHGIEDGNGEWITENGELKVGIEKCGIEDGNWNWRTGMGETGWNGI